MTSTTTNPPPPPPPPLTHILETCIYVRDVEASVKFYQETLGIAPFIESPRVTGFSLGPTTLLLFELGKTGTDVITPTGTIPLHGPTARVLASLQHSGANEDDSGEAQSLKQHFCLAVQTPEEVEQWEERLRGKGVKVLSTMGWKRGGRSVYFEDLDGHVVEIASRGVWPHY
ncbi:Glyoxalase/Bleomycin resistance protein/Dihydroxybiphenyl dioxygenase [Aspergillus germanicus]